jgi:predicted GIY-YIG superfamily endonuclease
VEAKPEVNWTVYLLVTPDYSRTYIGATTDIDRRLLQHNGKKRGGARATRNRQWELAACIHGFVGKREAYRWEKILKGRARGFKYRVLAFRTVGLAKECPPYGRRKQYPVPPSVHYWDPYIFSLPPSS